LLELVEAETVVDALLQDPAQLVVPFDDAGGEAAPAHLDSRRHAGRASPDDRGVELELPHRRPCSRALPFPFFVILSQGSPASLITILRIRDVQKPPWHRPIPARVKYLTPSSVVCPLLTAATISASDMFSQRQTMFP